MYKLRCHRSFLLSYMKLNELSLRGLQDQTDGYISIAALSKMLRTNKKGKFLAEFDVSTTTWVQIIYKLNLSEQEIKQAVFLKLFNELSFSRVKRLNYVKSIVKREIHQVESENLKFSDLSPKALYLAKAFDIFPERFQKKLIKEVLSLIELSGLGSSVVKARLNEVKSYLLRFV